MQKLGFLTIILLFLTTFTFGQPAAQLKKADELFDQGLAFQNNQQWDQAIQSYTEYIKILPRQRSAWYNRGLARYSKGIDFSHNTGDSSRKLLEEATADFTQAIELDSNWTDVWLARGEAYLMLRMFSNYAVLAVSDFTQAIKLDPNSSSAYRGRGMAYKENGQSDKALTDFSQAIRLDPQDAEAYFRRGQIYSSLNDLKSAKSDFEAAVRISPAHPYAKIWLDQTGQKINPSPVSAAPQTWQTAFETGKGFLQRNDADHAIASFQKALTLLPTNFAGDQIELLMAQQKGQILENIAKAYIAKKDYDNAINNCLSGQRFLHQTLVGKFAKVEKFKFEPGLLVEVSKSKIDLILIDFDLLLAQSGSVAEIGKRCFDAFPQSGLSTVQQLNLLPVGMMKIGTSEFVSNMFWTASSLRLSLSQLCQQKGKTLCGENSRNNEIAKHANKSLEDINKAIEYSPALKKLYLHRAAVYRHLGRNDLALADETKAGQLK